MRRLLNLAASMMLGLAFVAWPVFEHPVSRLSPRQDAARILAGDTSRPLSVQVAALPVLDSDGEPNTNGPSCAPALPGHAAGATPAARGMGSLEAANASLLAGLRLPRWGSALPPPSRLPA